MSVRLQVSSFVTCLDAVFFFVVSLLLAISSCLSKEIGITVFGLLIIIEFAEAIRIQVHSIKNTKQANGVRVMYKSIWNTVTSPTSILRIVIIIASLVTFMLLRLQLNGSNRLYKWTILENHISLLPNFKVRALSYAQMHFWYFWKLVYPRYLCFDYGHACIPLVHDLIDWRNILPLITYTTLAMLIAFAVKHARISLLLGMALLLVPLVPALNVVFPVGTLLAERLLFVPSIGYCFIVAELLLVDLADHWKSLSTTLFDPVVHAIHNKALHWMSRSKDAGKIRSGGDVKLGYKSVYFFVVPLLFLWTVRVWTRNEDWASETKLYASALKVCPQSLKALTNHALLSIQQKQLDEAVASARGALRIHPNQTAALVNAGIAYQRLDQFSSSILMFQRCLSVDPLNSKAHGYIGAALYDWSSSLGEENHTKEWRTQLNQAALQYFEQALSLGFSAPNVLHQMGSICMEIGQLELSVRYLEAALEKSFSMREDRGGSNHVPVEDDINIPFTYNQLGNVYRQIGQPNKAIDAFLKGLQVSPSTVQIHTNLGTLYRDIGQLDKAREVYMQGLELYSSGSTPPAALLNNLGLVEMDLGHYGEAVKLLEKALLILRGSSSTGDVEGKAIALDGDLSVEDIISTNIGRAEALLLN